MNLLFILSLFGLHAFANSTPSTSIGKITDVTGNAWIQNSQGKKQLKAGDTIASGDELVLDRSGRLKAMLGKKDAAILVKSDTRVKVEETSERDLELTLSQGRVLSSIRNPLKKPDHFHVKTRAVTLGVRGTVLYVSAVPKKPILFCDCRGTVSLKNEKNETREFIAKHHDAPVFIQDGKENLAQAIIPVTAGTDPDHSDQEIEELDTLLRD